MESTPETQNFGLTRVAQGEQFSKNGFAFSDRDVQTLDALLHALANHIHDGDDRLRGPEFEPDLVAMDSGGTLPSDTTFYYRVSFLDRWGLETEASDEVAVTTSEGVDAPPAPAMEVQEYEDGNISPGVYSYRLTVVASDGGESLASPSNDIRVYQGDIENPNEHRILIDLPDLPSGAEAFRIYRAKPGQTRFYFLQESDEELVYDDGTIPEDQSITTPKRNSTNVSNAVEVSIPEIPPGVFAWRIYRSVEPGVYDGQNLVHEVVEATTETGNDLRTTWIDTGDILLEGEPRFVTATIGGGRPLDDELEAGPGGTGSTGSRGARLWQTSIPEPSDGEFNRTHFPSELKPTALTVFFAEAPNPGASEQLRVQIRDEDDNQAELVIGEALAGEPYHRITWPLRDQGDAEAEGGTRSSDAPVVNDLEASNGQSVEIPEEGSHSEVEWGELELGEYRPFVTLKTIDSQPAEGPIGVRFEIYRADTGSVIGSSEIYVETPEEWEEHEGQTFAAPGGENIKFRVTNLGGEPDEEIPGIVVTWPEGAPAPYTLERSEDGDVWEMVDENLTDYEYHDATGTEDHQYRVLDDNGSEVGGVEWAPPENSMQVSWDEGATGPFTLERSANEGETWTLLVEDYSDYEYEDEDGTKDHIYRVWDGSDELLDMADVDWEETYPTDVEYTGPEIAYYVDKFRFQADVPILDAGPVSLQIEHVNPPTDPDTGSGMQVALWF